MRNLFAIVLVVLMGFALAGVQSVKADAVVAFARSVTNGVTYTNDVVASGWIDKIEISQSTAHTCTVKVATFDADFVAIDTYAVLSNATAKSTIVRPRMLPTSTAGVAVTAAEGTATNTTTMLNANYERPMIGGQTKVYVVGAGGAASTVNAIKVTVFYQPLAR